MQTTEQERWLPRDEKNPFKIWHLKTDEELKAITQWYDLSVRVLSKVGNKVEWLEIARSSSWGATKDIINALGKTTGKYYVVMKCTRDGKEGREKPVLWYPSEGSVRAAMKQEAKDVGKSQ